MDRPDLNELIGIIQSVARRELLTRFERVHQGFKQDGSIVTEADYAVQQGLEISLHERWPQIAFLGEEMPQTEQERILSGGNDGVWIVDPLDGTSNFSLGIPCFAVSLALIVAGQIELGVVYDPARDECFSAQRGRGASLNNRVLNLTPLAHVETITIGLVDFKRLDSQLAGKLVSSPPYKSQRSIGSVALEWCWIAAGRGDVYVHGKQNLWDYAAAQLILTEAGGFAATLQDEPVYNGGLEPRSAVLAINQQLFDTWRAYLQSNC